MRKVRNGKLTDVIIQPRKPRRAAAADEVRTPWRGEGPAPAHRLEDPDTRVYVGDCRAIIPTIPECAKGTVDCVFADPPFNWNRAYDKWNDALPDREYLDFTYAWLDACNAALREGGAFWVNIPDDWAAEIVVHLKGRGLRMVNWCIWHYRFGQNVTERFINSKVHALYFVKGGMAGRTWNPLEVLEVSDRASIYFDPRTQSKRDGMPAAGGCRWMCGTGRTGGASRATTKSGAPTTTTNCRRCTWSGSSAPPPTPATW